MDPILIALTCITAAVALYLLIFEGRVWGKKKDDKNPSGRRNPRNAAGRRRVPYVHPQMTQDDFESLSDPTNSDNDSGAPDVEEDNSKASEQPKKKVGTKKAQKLAEKERRKEEREAEERYRIEQRKKEDEEIRKRKEAESKEAALEAAAAAAEEKLRLEQEAREQAEYEKLKSTFSIEGEGTGIKQLDEDAEEQINREFVDIIQEAKIISLERLCVLFDLKTDACVDKIRTLVAKGTLSGILDDRGKFIFIEPSEYESIAKFIELRGRVTMSELVEQCNKVIKARAVSAA